MNFGGINAFTSIMIFAHIYYTNAVGIDDKLDFGDRRSHSSFINDGIHKKLFSSVNNPSSSINVDNFDSVGVVCVSEGCNTTKSTDESGDTINTDVVVHIKTKVNLNQNKTKSIEDTPDIPVVVGTDNSNFNNYDGVRTEPKSIFIPDDGPSIYQNTRHRTQGSNFYSSGTDNSNFNNYDGVRTKPKTIFIPDDRPSIYQNTRSRTQGSNFYSPGSQYGSSMSFYPYQSNGKLDPATFYQNMINPNPEVNINFRSSPPIAMDITSDLLTTNFKTSGIEMSVPYFDSSLHRHHYSETPPPQYVLYPKHVGVMNPVEFKVMRPNWRPSQWQNQFNQDRHGVLPTGTVKCFCENDGRTDFHGYRSETGRSSVYSPSRVDSVNDPGAQINDKLAPLN